MILYTEFKTKSIFIAWVGTKHFELNILENNEEQNNDSKIPALKWKEGRLLKKHVHVTTLSSGI